MTNPPRPSVHFWLWAGIALTAGKLWLTGGLTVYAIGFAAHDDRLFLQLAESIIQGQWLGPYSQMTLAKGPFYSIWIALMFFLGVPLLLSVQLAYAGACALLVRACRPAIRSGAVLFAIYAFLLWNPMSFETATLGRVIRQQIYTPLELAALAGLIALYYRRGDGLRRQLSWAVLLGLAFGCFWLTREESVWLVPSVLLLAGAALFRTFRDSRAHCRTLLASLGLALFCAGLPIFIISWQNYRHYGWLGTVEFRAPEFKDAYGAMVRVNIGPNLNYIPVTRQAREAMYAVSPTFAKLQPYLEGDYGRGWAAASAVMTGLPPEERQIGSGWLMWALRDTVAAAGFCHSAREALDFYQRMADEINRACEDGRLPAHPRRSGFLPRWKEGETAEVLRTVWNFTDFVTGYQSFTALQMPSLGGYEDLRLFRDLTRDRLSNAPQIPLLALPNQAALDLWKLNILQGIGKVQRQALLILFISAHPIALLRLLRLAWTRGFSFPLVLAAAAWGGSFGYLVLNAIVQVSSFSVVSVSTFWPVYPLLQLFTVAVFCDAGVAWGGWIVARRTAAKPGDVKATA